MTRTITLTQALASQQWPLAAKLAKEFPDQVAALSRRDGFFDGKTQAQVLPLHEALVAGAPLSVIQALVQQYPRALAKQESSYARLPLHCACRKGADMAVVDFLVQSYKRACLAPDALGRVPLHYALTNGAEPEIIALLMRAAPRAARAYDHKNWTPVHVAMSVGASESIVKTLLAANPESVLMKTKMGSSIRSVIPTLRQKSLRVERLQLV